MSMNAKKIRKEKQLWNREDQILETHILYKWDSTKSPHFLVRKWFHRLQANCIILKNPKEFGTSNHRKIFYGIDYVGKNIRYSNVNNYMNLHVENTKG